MNTLRALCGLLVLTLLGGCASPSATSEAREIPGQPGRPSLQQTRTAPDAMAPPAIAPDAIAPDAIAPSAQPLPPQPGQTADLPPVTGQKEVAGVFAKPKAEPKPEVKPEAEVSAFKALAQAYVAAFNARDVDAMLGLYDPKARISKETDNGVTYISVDQYRRYLAEKMQGYADKGTRIVGHEIKSYKLKGDRADLIIVVTVEQYIFSVKRTGTFELTRSGDGWKIIKDDS